MRDFRVAALVLVKHSTHKRDTFGWRVIDVAIAIMLFKEMLKQDERAQILSQSDQIQEWRETLDKSEFLETKAQLFDQD